MQTAPTNIQDLVHSSIYFELLNNNEESLEFFCDDYLNVNSDIDSFRDYLDMNDAGNIVYYSTNSRGEFMISPVGEFVRVHIPQNNGALESRYVHYSQLFKPSKKVKAELDLLVIVLGVMYQGTRIQLAKTDSYLREAEDENRQLAQISRVYGRLSTAVTNFDPQKENAFTTLSANELKCFLELGLQSPMQNFITGIQSMPFYEEYLYKNLQDRYLNILPGAKLQWFFWEVEDGKLQKKILLEKSGLAFFDSQWPLPAAVFREELNSFSENPQKIVDFLMAEGTELVSEITFDPFRRPIQRRYGIGKCEDDCYEIENWISAESPQEIRPLDFAERHSWEWIKARDATVYLNRGQLQTLADTLRLEMDTLNHRLESVMTRIQLANNELQEIYNMATNTLSATEDTRRKVTSNLRT